MALSLHAIFEGVAVGLSSSVSFVWSLFIAIAAHKFVIAFCVGMQFATSGVKPLVTLIYMSTFASITPIGIGIGIALTETTTSETDIQSAAVTVLQVRKHVFLLLYSLTPMLFCSSDSLTLVYWFFFHLLLTLAHFLLLLCSCSLEVILPALFCSLSSFCS